MVAAGARFVAARHEGGAATMADAYARMSGTVAAVSVHQGCGLTNAMTGITEAAKSRTPLIVVAADVTEQRSNFYVDQDALARAVGAVPITVDDPAACARGRRDGGPYGAGRPAHGRAQPAARRAGRGGARGRCRPGRRRTGAISIADGAIEPFAALLEAAEAPVFVAGRGARGARRELELLAGHTGALLAT